MSSWSWKAGLAGIAIVAIGAAATAYAVAQMGPDHSQMQGMHGQMQGGMHGQMMGGQHARTQGPRGMHQQPGQGDHGMMGGMGGMRGHGMMGPRTGLGGQPSLPGQDAFGAIQEVVQALEADPNTDWSKVNIAALREHLVDMNEVTLRASASERALVDGIEITVTGEGRTLAAIKRMVPAHARELAATGWNAKTEELPNGVKLLVTTSDKGQVAKLKALGFMGIMVQGGHHQPHHLLMAKGEFSAH
jgi:hypothetical protein